MSQIRGAASYIMVDESGSAHIEARHCTACGARCTRRPLACPGCGRRDTLEVYRVGQTGKLHAWSIVHRSFPGVTVPFISAIVDMDDGTVLKGNLRGVAPTPDALAFDMPVRVVFDDAGRTDAQGNRYISYFFEAA